MEGESDTDFMKRLWNHGQGLDEDGQPKVKWEPKKVEAHVEGEGDFVHYFDDEKESEQEDSDGED